MAWNDITSTSVTSGEAIVTYNPMMILVVIAVLAAIFFLLFGKKKAKGR